MNKKQAKFSVEALESTLSQTYQPVKPDNGLVSTIRRRITLAPPSVVAERISNPNRLLMIVGGVVSGMILLLTLARVLYYLVGSREHS